MQIQDNVRRVTNADARAESPDAFRGFTRPSLQSSTDAFAQIFEAIAASYAPKQEPNRNPATGLQEVSKREDIAENESLSEEKDDSLKKDDEAQNAASPTTALPYPVQPLAVSADQPQAVKPADAVVEKSSECCSESKNPRATETENALVENGDADASYPTTPTANADLVISDPAVVASADESPAPNDSPGAKLEPVIDGGNQRDFGKRLDDGVAQEKPIDATERLQVPPSVEPNMNTGPDSKNPSADASTADAFHSDDETENAIGNEAATDDRRDRRDRRDTGDVRATNAARQDASQDRQTSQNNQSSITSSTAMQPSASDIGLASSPGGPTPGANAATPTSPGAAVPLGTTAGVLAAASATVSSSPGRVSSSAPDTLAIGTGSASNDSLIETTAAPSTPASRQSEIADRARLVHRIAKAFQKMGVDGGHVRLKMHPEELGGVQLEMQVIGRTINATVTAENEQARQVIQANLPELRQRLESQGLIIERFDVQTRTDGDGAGASNQNQQQTGTGFGDESRRRDGVWRPQDEARPGRSNARSAELAALRSDGAAVGARKTGASWLVDRGLDVKL